MPELNREDIIKALECFHLRILNTKLAEKITETEIMAIINALTLIKQLTEENERLRDSSVDYRNIPEIKTEFAKQIFEEIEYILNHIGYLDHIDFEKLKKKYIGE